MDANLQKLLAVREGHRKILNRDFSRTEMDDITSEELTMVIEKIAKLLDTLKGFDENILSKTEAEHTVDEMFEADEFMYNAKVKLGKLRKQLQTAGNASNPEALGTNKLAPTCEPAPFIPATNTSMPLSEEMGGATLSEPTCSTESSEPTSGLIKIEQSLKNQSISSPIDEELDEKSISEAVDELEETVVKKGINGLKERLQKSAENWKKIPINIAVTGSSGAGKSSFVNAFLGLSEDDDNAAKVGVNETTTTLRVFFNQNRPNLKIWDMPGVGTPNFPRDSYTKKVNFEQYDFFLLLSRVRFTDEDLWLAREVQSRSKKFYFIRTCIDSDISSMTRRNPETNANDLQKSVREDIKANLRKAKIVNPMIFLVDNLAPHAYEFQNVDQQLLQDCDDIKREALVFSLSNMTTKAFLKKKEELKKRAEKKAIQIACEYERREKQEELFNEEINFQAEQFGIDQTTLMENNDIISISEKNIEQCKNIWSNLRSCLKNIPQVTVWYKIIRRWKRIMQLSKVDVPEHSEATVKFCLMAFEQNIDEMYKLALEMYGQRTQEALVKTSVYSRT